MPWRRSQRFTNSTIFLYFESDKMKMLLDHFLLWCSLISSKGCISFATRRNGENLALGWFERRLYLSLRAWISKFEGIAIKCKIFQPWVYFWQLLQYLLCFPQMIGYFWSSEFLCCQDILYILQVQGSWFRVSVFPRWFSKCELFTQPSTCSHCGARMPCKRIKSWYTTHIKL